MREKAQGIYEVSQLFFISMKQNIFGDTLYSLFLDAIASLEIGLPVIDYFVNFDIRQ